MSKEVPIPRKPSRESDPGGWIESRKLPRAEKRTKRITLDVDVDLHRRIRLRCFEEDVTMTDKLLDIVAESFPPNASAPDSD